MLRKGLTVIVIPCYVSTSENVILTFLGAGVGEKIKHVPCSFIQQIFIKCCCVPGTMLGVLFCFVFKKKSIRERSGTSLVSAALVRGRFEMHHWKIITRGAGDLGARSPLSLAV